MSCNREKEIMLIGHAYRLSAFIVRHSSLTDVRTLFQSLLIALKPVLWEGQAHGIATMMLASFCYCLSITAWTHWNLWVSLHHTIAPITQFIHWWTDGMDRWEVQRYRNTNNYMMYCTDCNANTITIIIGIMLAHALGSWPAALMPSFDI